MSQGVNAFELFGTVGIDTASFDRSAAQIDARLTALKTKFDQTEKSASNAGGGLDKAGKSSQGFSRELTNLQREVDTANSKLGSLATSALSVFAGNVLSSGLDLLMSGLTKSLDVMKDLVKTGLQFDDQFRRATVTLTALSGSADIAHSHLEEIKKLAVDRAFEFPGLVKADQRLEAVGITGNKTIPALKGIVAITAALGGEQSTLDRIVSAFDQMGDKSGVAGRQIMQLERSGVPVLRTLAEATGLSVKALENLANKNRINGDAAISILTQGWEQKFGRVAEDLAQKTTSGLYTSLQQKLAQVSGDAVLPLQEEIIKRLGQVNSALGSQIAEGIAQGINQKSTSVLSAVDGMVDALINKAKSMLGIHSPSTVFAEMGLMAMAGLGQGFEQGTEEAKQKLRESLEKILNDPRVQAFLQAIRNAEGADYDTLYGGKKWDLSKGFPWDFAGGRSKAGPTHAALGYQFEPSTWARFASSIGVDKNQVDPHTQDLVAAAILAKFGALDSLLNNNIQLAIAKVLSQWPSLPGGSQQRRTLDQFLGAMVGSGIQASRAPMTESRMARQMADERDFRKYINDTIGMDTFQRMDSSLAKSFEDIWRKVRASQQSASLNPISQNSGLLQGLNLSPPGIESVDKVLAQVRDMLPVIDTSTVDVNAEFKKMAGEFGDFGLGLPPLSDKMKQFGATTQKALGLSTAEIEKNRKAILSATETLQQKLKDIGASIPSLHQQLEDLVVSLPKGVGDVFGNAVKEFDGTFKGLFRSIEQGFASLLQNMASQLISSAVTKFLSGMLSNLADGGGWIGGILSAIGYAGGGLVSGPGTSSSDSVPAMLSNGEYIIRADVVSLLGRGFFDKLNAGIMPHFNVGGIVDAQLLSQPTIMMKPAISGDSGGKGNVTNNFHFDIDIHDKQGFSTPTGGSRPSRTQIETQLAEAVLRGMKFLGPGYS